MVTKSTKPTTVEPDFGTMSLGMIDVLVHWDIVEKTGMDMNGNSYTYYSYSEERLRVACPKGSETEITAYLISQYQRFLIRCGVDDRLTAVENILANQIEGTS